MKSKGLIVTLEDFKVEWKEAQQRWLGLILTMTGQEQSCQNKLILQS